ncbi:MAG: copper transporter [Coriobacteriia bacterium]|nr:copper transporter [Coriobacteriia bacterium]
MYNLRYHIASLVSVFIALALGLVLGGLIVDEGSPVNNQAMIDSLQADYAAVREQSAMVQSENDLLMQFSDSITSEAITDQLEGYSVIVLNGDNDTADEVVGALTRADAIPLLFSIDNEKLAQLEEDGELSDLFDKPEPAENEGNTNANETSTDAAEPIVVESIQQIATELAREWTDAGMAERPYTDALIAAGILNAPAFDWSAARILGLVDTTDSQEVIEPDLSSATLVAFSKRSYPAVLVSRDATAYLIFDDTLDAKNISVINNMDSSMGKFSLVALMKGGAAGRYGMMEDAVATFASMPEVLTVAGEVPQPEPTPATPTEGEEAPTGQ